MDFTISSASLANVMQAVASRLPSQPTIAVYGGVLVTASDGEVTLRTTDMSTSTRATVQTLVEEPGETVVSAKMLQSISKSLPDAPVRFSTSGDAAQVECLKSRWRLHTLNPADFPKWEDFDPDGSFEIPRRLLAEMVEMTGRAAARDESRPVLKAINAVVSDGTLSLTATDALRVSVTRAEVDGDDLAANIPSQALRGAMAAKSSAETVTIGCSGRQVCIDDGTLTYVTRAIEGSYPNVAALMPKSFRTRVCLDSEEFASALKRAGILASVDPSVALSFDGDMLTIRAVSSNDGESTETIPIDLEGDPVTIGFNHHYVLDCVDRMGGELTMRLNGPTDPALFTGNGDIDATYMLLPVRV